jgi:hypothetical protein
MSSLNVIAGRSALIRAGADAGRPAEHARRIAEQVERLAAEVRRLDELETGAGGLLVEWSAAPGAEVDDPAAWRQASAHWSPRRERTVRAQLKAAQAGYAPGRGRA